MCRGSLNDDGSVDYSRWKKESSSPTPIIVLNHRHHRSATLSAIYCLCWACVEWNFKLMLCAIFVSQVVPLFVHDHRQPRSQLSSMPTKDSLHRSRRHWKCFVCVERDKHNLKAMKVDLISFCGIIRCHHAAIEYMRSCSTRFIISDSQCGWTEPDLLYLDQLSLISCLSSCLSMMLTSRTSAMNTWLS